jgi:hypothetical protein
MSGDDFELQNIRTQSPNHRAVHSLGGRSAVDEEEADRRKVAERVRIKMDFPPQVQDANNWPVAQFARFCHRWSCAKLIRIMIG